MPIGKPTRQHPDVAGIIDSTDAATAREYRFRLSMDMAPHKISVPDRRPIA
jgi:hypothetical protein